MLLIRKLTFFVLQNVSVLANQQQTRETVVFAAQALTATRLETSRLLVLMLITNK